MGPALIIIAVILAVILFSTAFTVKHQTVAIVETLGKFHRTYGPGLHFKIPLIQRVAGRLSIRVQQLDVRVETKTLDNVFVNVIVSVQYFVVADKVYDAFYRLSEPSGQITSFVFDVVRAQVPKLKLDDVYVRKDDIALAVQQELNETMDEFGYGIMKTLVTDIDPDAKVKEAMNEINAAERLRVAANEKGEADKILQVKAAEAEAESKALQGKGIADQRMAIVEGLRESVEEFQTGVPGTSANDVMNLILMTQYFDTMKEISDCSTTNTIFLPHQPGGMASIAEQMREALISGHIASDAIDKSKSES